MSHIEEPQSQDTLDLSDYLRVLRRRKVVILATLILVVAVAMAVTALQTPIYEAEVRLVPERFEDPATSADAALQQLVFGQSELETQREVVTSHPVAQIVVAELGLDMTAEELLEDVTVSLVGESQVLEIRATSEDPQLSAAIAQGFADAYLDYRRDQELERNLEAVNRLQERARQIRLSLEEVAEEQAGATGSELAALEQEEEALLGQLGAVQAQIAGLSGSGMASGGGEIIQPAAVPEEPASPKPLRTGILAVVLGAMLGVGLAFLRDFLDDSIRSDDAARRAIGGGPVLAHIPQWKNATQEGVEGLAAYVAPASVTGEAYQTLHTNLRFMEVSRHLKSVLVTSAASGDGKTTTAANMAVAATRSGRHVILVGADFRRPKLHRVFGLEGRAGMTELLAREAKDLADVVYDVDMPNLRVVPSGAVPPNPAELLSSGTMAQAMARLTQMADLVVYDGPPVLAVADAIEIAPRVGGVVLVVSWATSGRHATRATAERLRSVGADVVGVVVNNIPRSGDTAYQYYAEYYGDDLAAEGNGAAKMSRRQRRKQRNGAGTPAGR